MGFGKIIFQLLLACSLNAETSLLKILIRSAICKNNQNFNEFFEFERHYSWFHDRLLYEVKG